MAFVLAALLIGMVAGLRTMTALAAVSWAAALGWLDLSTSWLAFLGFRWTPWIVTALALAEFVTDQLPATPSRKVPLQFAGRVLIGAVCGAAFGVAADSVVPGLLAGAVGAVMGTLGGAAARTRMAAALGSDRPAGLLEDAAAIVAAGLIMVAAT